MPDLCLHTSLSQPRRSPRPYPASEALFTIPSLQPVPVLSAPLHLISCVSTQSFLPFILGQLVGTDLASETQKCSAVSHENSIPNSPPAPPCSAGLNAHGRIGAFLPLVSPELQAWRVLKDFILELLERVPSIALSSLAWQMRTSNALLCHPPLYTLELGSLGQQAPAILLLQPPTSLYLQIV